jgi:hypothetical protein
VKATALLPEAFVVAPPLPPTITEPTPPPTPATLLPTPI